jgi:protein SCO1/2
MMQACAAFRHAARVAAVASLATAAAAQEPSDGPGGRMLDHSGHTLDQSPSALEEHGIVVDFELVDGAGNSVTDEDFRGRYLLLGFGFTHCAHICPLMAFNMGQVLSAADASMAGIFVSVDTERDTPAVTNDYASHFGDGMIGLGGSIEQINAAAKNFKVSYAITKTQDNYTVQHTANVFLIDPQGALVDVFNFTTAPEDILAAIR